MPPIAARFDLVEESATLRMSAIARSLRAQDVDVVDLGSGSPDFVTPEHVREGAKDALDRGETFTTATPGVSKLRELIAEKLQVENDVQTDADRVVVTDGTKHAIFQAIAAVVDPGDEVVIPDPSFVSYRQMVRLVGGQVERLPLDPASGFSLAETDVAAVIDDDTRAIVLNTPANPSGAVYSADELATIRDLAIDHDCWVITDEIYERMIFEGTHHSLATMDGMADRTITTNGFSKTYAMTGWRLGYLTGPQHVVDAITKFQAHSVTCPTSFAQYGGIAALEGPDEPVEEMCQSYEDRLGLMYDELTEHGVSIPRPRGGFFCFVPVESGYDDVELCERWIEDEHVCATPGSAFGTDGYVRLSVTTEPDRIREGIDRIAPYLAT